VHGGSEPADALDEVGADHRTDLVAIPEQSDGGGWVRPIPQGGGGTIERAEPAGWFRCMYTPPSAFGDQADGAHFCRHACS
jgi:hypothetical protein